MFMIYLQYSVLKKIVIINKESEEKRMITNTILQNLINFLAPVVGIAIVIFCVIQAFKIFRGQEGGSVKSLLIGVGILLLILGIMFAAGSFETYGKLFQGITNTIIEQGGGDIGNIVGGTPAGE